MQRNFKEENYSLRSKASHNMECKYIEDMDNEIGKRKLRLLYGINQRSRLSELPGFDVTKQLPQDLMHTILEGTLQYEVRLGLQYFLDNNMISLVELNAAVTNHNYGYSEMADKPSPLKETVFNVSESYKLKYNAAQARIFLKLLSFFLLHSIDVRNKYFLFLSELMRIVDLLYSPIIKIESVQVLKQLIFEHLIKFKELFPDANITPKQHYMIHLPSMIINL